MTEVRAQVQYLRIAPRKARLVADMIKNLPVSEAESHLMYERKRAAKPLLKLLHSAVANAAHNNALDKDKLYIKRIIVDQGPSLKRIRFRAQGRTALILKRSSHITLVLDELKGKKVKTLPLKGRAVIEGKAERREAVAPKGQVKIPQKPIEKQTKRPFVSTRPRLQTLGQKVSGFTKRIFRRKAI